MAFDDLLAYRRRTQEVAVDDLHALRMAKVAATAADRLHLLKLVWRVVGKKVGIDPLFDWRAGETKKWSVMIAFSFCLWKKGEKKGKHTEAFSGYFQLIKEGQKRKFHFQSHYFCVIISSRFSMQTGFGGISGLAYT